MIRCRVIPHHITLSKISGPWTRFVSSRKKYFLRLSENKRWRRSINIHYMYLWTHFYIFKQIEENGGRESFFSWRMMLSLVREEMPRAAYIFLLFSRKKNIWQKYRHVDTGSKKKSELVYNFFPFISFTYFLAHMRHSIVLILCCDALVCIACIFYFLWTKKSFVKLFTIFYVLLLHITCVCFFAGIGIFVWSNSFIFLVSFFPL